MEERKMINVSKGTYDLMDSKRDGRSWDNFLRKTFLNPSNSMCLENKPIYLKEEDIPAVKENLTVPKPKKEDPIAALWARYVDMALEITGIKLLALTRERKASLKQILDLKIEDSAIRNFLQSRKEWKDKDPGFKSNWIEPKYLLRSPEQYMQEKEVYMPVAKTKEEIKTPDTISLKNQMYRAMEAEGQEYLYQDFVRSFDETGVVQDEYKGFLNGIS